MVPLKLFCQSFCCQVCRNIQFVQVSNFCIFFSPISVRVGQRILRLQSFIQATCSPLVRRWEVLPHGHSIQQWNIRQQYQVLEYQFIIFTLIRPKFASPIAQFAYLTGSASPWRNQRWPRSTPMTFWGSDPMFWTSLVRWRRSVSSAKWGFSTRMDLSAPQDRRPQGSTDRGSRIKSSRMSSPS